MSLEFLKRMQMMDMIDEDERKDAVRHLIYELLCLDPDDTDGAAELYNLFLCTEDELTYEESIHVANETGFQL